MIPDLTTEVDGEQHTISIDWVDDESAELCWHIIGDFNAQLQHSLMPSEFKRVEQVIYKHIDNYRKTYTRDYLYD